MQKEKKIDSNWPGVIVQGLAEGCFNLSLAVESAVVPEILSVFEDERVLTALLRLPSLHNLTAEIIDSLVVLSLLFNFFIGKNPSIKTFHRYHSTLGLYPYNRF